MLAEKTNAQQIQSIGVSGFFNKFRLIWLQQQKTVGKLAHLTTSIDCSCSAQKLVQELNANANTNTNSSQLK